MLRPFLTILLFVCATAARADVPRVLTDIPPVHSLVAQVMGDVGTPDVLVTTGGDAHHMALRPSDARKLDQADIVVWIGDALTPWLDDPLRTLAPTAATLTLLAVPGWTPLTHEDHGGAVDPHAWLDPDVAKIWIGAIRDTLSTTDPDNAMAYARNADVALRGIDTTATRVTGILADVAPGTWLAPHDAFVYFETRFDFPAAGAVADSEAAAPGPAHLADLRERIEDGQITCVMSETTGTDDRARTLTEDTDAQTGQIDVAGAGLTPGPDLYGAMLVGIAQTLRDCVAP